MNKHLTPILVLVSICIAAALLLSLVNMITAPIIEQAQNASANKALLEVLPDGKNFVELEITSDYPEVVTAGYKADGGFVFQMSVNGYQPGLVIMCGIDSDGKIVGVKHIQSNETYGLEKELNGAYIGATLDSAELIIASGATPKSNTSKAYFDAIKAALQAFAIANGASVDIRTPEQILQDNCNTALGSSGITFNKWFATEVLEGIDAVYEASDASGRVYVIGETFVGVKADGTIVSLGDANEATIKAADSAVKSSDPTEITTLPEGVNKNMVKKISVTESGNYVFELETKGYACLNSHYATGITIKIKLSISADGKIIDCLTVSHGESNGIGDVCATEEYYEQYRGASGDDINITVQKPTDDYTTPPQTPAGTTDIGAISGASFTATAYQKAVKAAFEAYDLLIAGGASND